MSSVAELKAKGNADFAAKRYEEAIAHYTAAIEAAKGEADAPHVLYSNRSACYSGLKNYEQALADAEKVCKLTVMHTRCLDLLTNPVLFPPLTDHRAEPLLRKGLRPQRWSSPRRSPL